VTNSHVLKYLISLVFIIEMVLYWIER